MLKAIPPLHFPIAFPEVFLRESAGFDVILGNPPWEKTQVEEHEFWSRYSPGFRGLSQAERETAKKRLIREYPDLAERFLEEKQAAEGLRKALLRGRFPGMGTGHPDLYKAFSYRFMILCAPRGHVGVVLPRSAFSGAGSSEFRRKIFTACSIVAITMLVNARGWVFDDVHEQYAVGLTILQRGEPSERSIRLGGPFTSLTRFRAGVATHWADFRAQDVMNWTDTASLPLFPSEESVFVFAQLRRAPRLDFDDSICWKPRPVQGDINATKGKNLMQLREPTDRTGYWPVYRGESFGIWQPDTSQYYAWVKPDKILHLLQEKRLRAGEDRRSAFFEFPKSHLRDETTLPCRSARIAFRDSTNRLNERTVICALVPPQVILAHQAPYLVWPRGDEKDQAFLLGVLSSLPLDWYARRFVERHLFFYLFDPLPIPRPERKSDRWQRVVMLAGRLACPDKRFRKWAEAVGVEYGPIRDDEREDMIYELDAVVAHLYGLSAQQLTHIFQTFHEERDNQRDLDATLVHFRRWASNL